MQVLRLVRRSGLAQDDSRFLIAEDDRALFFELSFGARHPYNSNIRLTAPKPAAAADLCAAAADA
jgi:hypothetical protein